MRYAAVMLIGALALVACRPGKPDGSSASPHSAAASPKHSVYVWQAAALENAESLPDIALWWFAGQVDLTTSGPIVEAFPSPPRHDGAEFTGLVYRLRTPVIEWLPGATDDEIRDGLAVPLARSAASNRVQLDFDCPTAKLNHYIRLVAQMREALPNVELSITALPDWLGSSDFAKLAAQVDFYVLQVHGLTLPATLDDPAPIFDPTRAARYVEAATAIGLPFHVALPTYGHRQWFRADGSFIGISAEPPTDLSPSAHMVREARADPAEVVAFVRLLESQRSALLQGQFWFRMPAAGDELNWCMDTFRHVVAGENPPETLRLELHETEPGLVSVHLHNAPDHDYRGRAEVRLTFASGVQVLGEGLRGFTLEQRGNEMMLTGRGPAPGENMDIGWIRSMGKESLNTESISLRVRSLQ